MRWTHPTPPKKGDTRTRSGFLWWPKTIGLETRWLERTAWREIAAPDCPPGWVHQSPRWVWAPEAWG